MKFMISAISSCTQAILLLSAGFYLFSLAILLFVIFAFWYCKQGSPPILLMKPPQYLSVDQSVSSNFTDVRPLNKTEEFTRAINQELGRL